MEVKTYIKRNGKNLVIRLTKSKGRLIYEHICFHCGLDFISNRITAIYCSDKCKKAEYREKKKKSKETISRISMSSIMEEIRIKNKMGTL